jgi:hypothetical protein
VGFEVWRVEDFGALFGEREGVLSQDGKAVVLDDFLNGRQMLDRI